MQASLRWHTRPTPLTWKEALFAWPTSLTRLKIVPYSATKCPNSGLYTQAEQLEMKLYMSNKITAHALYLHTPSHTTANT